MFVCLSDLPVLFSGCVLLVVTLCYYSVPGLLFSTCRFWSFVVCFRSFLRLLLLSMSFLFICRSLVCSFVCYSSLVITALLVSLFVGVLRLFLSFLPVLRCVSKCWSRYLFIYFSPSSGPQIYVCEACASLLTNKKQQTTLSRKQDVLKDLLHYIYADNLLF